MPTDVIVIGAGGAGLVAARDLARAGKRVTVLEARDRVGGRTYSVDSGGQTIDLGGQWMGDKHARLRALATELGVESFAQHATGKKILWRGERRTTFTGFLPSIGMLPLLDLGVSLLRLERAAKRVMLDDPMTTKRAAELDAQSAADWLARHVRSDAARDMLGLATQMIFAAEPSQLSMLYVLLYARSGEGFQRLCEIRNGAQDRRFALGMQAISDRLATQSREAGVTIELSTPARAIEQTADGVTVHTATGSHSAGRAIVAVPPALACKIDGLGDRAALHAKLPMGSVIKCIASYDRAFWRDDGYSGEAFSTRGTLRATFDDCSPDGRHAALVGFVVGDAAKALRALPEAERKTRLLDELAHLHGPRARTPTAYVDKDWQADEWAAGCYVGVMPPGVVSEVGTVLRTPRARVHFAGTETAIHHIGYIEGAIESGQRVAREICETGYVERPR